MQKKKIGNFGLDSFGRLFGEESTDEEQEGEEWRNEKWERERDGEKNLSKRNARADHATLNPVNLIARQRPEFLGKWRLDSAHRSMGGVLRSPPFLPGSCVLIEECH